jgi:hypothetical protein
VHVTVVVPTANVDPDVGEQPTEAEAPRSVADGVANPTTAPPGEVASAKMSDGTLAELIVGGVVSRTVTEKSTLELCPLPSLAVQCTVLVVIAKIEPESGEQSTGREPVTTSVAVGLE